MKREEFVSKINEAGLGGKVFVNPNNYAGGPYFLGCFFDGNQWAVSYTHLTLPTTPYV